MRRSDAVAGGIVGLVILGCLCGVRVDNLHNGLLAASFGLVGAFLLHHRRRDLEAPLFLAAGLGQAVLFLGRQVGGAPPTWLAPSVTRWIGWFGVWPVPVAMILVGAAIMRFPDGNLPGPAWRRIHTAMVSLGVTLGAMSALWSIDYERAGVVSSPPFSLPGAAVAGRLFEVAQPVVFTSFQVMWLVSVAVRRSRATPDEKRQLRWLTAAVGVCALVLLVGLAAQQSPRAGLLTLPLIPIAAGIAIVEASYERLVREVREAALRTVAAEDAARQRIERDLHDGAQHRLVVLGMDLGRIVDKAEAVGEPDLAEAAGAARDRLLEATAELRDLARGIHPLALTQDGLLVALEAVVDGSQLPVSLDVADDLGCAPHVETTAYYVVIEALTNATRYSGGSRVNVRIEARRSFLHIAVDDDGRGGASMGGGLRGVADRVMSVGGRFAIDSPEGRGTSVRAVLPCR